MDSTDVLLSVRPQHAEAIVQGRKKYELRRTIFKREDIGQVYVYSTSPMRKIVGSFEVGCIIEDTPDGIWETCHRYAGVSEEEFFRYFEGAMSAFAIRIANVRRFASPIDPGSILDDFRPPQSFRYLPIAIDFRGENGKRRRATPGGTASSGKTVRRLSR